MNSIGRLFAMHDTDYVLLPAPAKRELVYSVLLYMFRVIDSPSLSVPLKSILGWEGQDCINFRKSLTVSGVIQRDLKFYTYARIIGDSNALAGINISEADKNLVKNLLRSQDNKAQSLVKRCKTYARKGYTPKTIQTLERTMGQALHTLNTYCKKFVNKKFRFLTQSGQLGVDDTCQDLLEFGVSAIYKAYPVIKTSLHMVNIAKTAIHNRGQNIIKEQTTTSRGRLTKQVDGTFAGNIISLGQLVVADQIPEMGFGPVLVANSLVTGLDGRSVEGEQFTDVNRRRDLEQTVDRILLSLSSTKKKQFVTLLMGHYDEKFTSWLGRDNDEYWSRVDRKIYANKVREYLEVPPTKAREFVLELRSQLQDFRN